MDARELIDAMLAHDPEITSIEAGSESYRWLLAHVVEWAADERPTSASPAVRERHDLPPNLIVLSDANGNELSSVEVSELDEPGTDEAHP